MFTRPPTHRLLLCEPLGPPSQRGQKPLRLCVEATLTISHVLRAIRQRLGPERAPRDGQHLVLRTWRQHQTNNSQVVVSPFLAGGSMSVAQWHALETQHRDDEVLRVQYLVTDVSLDHLQKIEAKWATWSG